MTSLSSKHIRVFLGIPKLCFKPIVVYTEKLDMGKIKGNNWIRWKVVYRNVQFG